MERKNQNPIINWIVKSKILGILFFVIIGAFTVFKLPVVCPHAAECIGLIETQLDIQSAFPIAFIYRILKGRFYFTFDHFVCKAAYRMTCFDRFE